MTVFFFYPDQTALNRLRTKSELKPAHLPNTRKAFICATLRSYYIFMWYTGEHTSGHTSGHTNRHARVSV